MLPLLLRSSENTWSPPAAATAALLLYTEGWLQVSYAVPLIPIAYNGCATYERDCIHALARLAPATRPVSFLSNHGLQPSRTYPSSTFSIFISRFHQQPVSAALVHPASAFSTCFSGCLADLSRPVFVSVAPALACAFLCNPFA